MTDGRFIKAFMLLTWITAFFHFLTQAVMAFRTRSIRPFNYFHILTIDELFPALSGAFLPSLVVVAIVFFIAYALIKK
ncbi:MAG: hypothetical protein ABIH34_04375 [Nanoarchaeota archaeon]